MASYRGHLLFSSLLGAGCGTAAVLCGGEDWGQGCLLGGVTALGGLLPDLDSDSGVPVRELFGTAAAIVPILLYPRLEATHPTEQAVVIMGGIYLLIRYVFSRFFKRLTVHRGMFHSIPGMLIAGLAVFLGYHGLRMYRTWLAGGVMLGFLSHLVLDELCSVDLMGVRIRLNKYAGSALKLYSHARFATFLTYCMLGGLGYLAWLNWQAG